MRKPRIRSESTSSKSAVLRKQMEDLKAELRRVEAEEDASFGRMARKAGLFDLDISEADLKEAVKEMVETFRARTQQPSEAAAPPYA